MEPFQHSQVNIIETKLVLLGASSVGKTALSVKYTQGYFQKRLTPTIGASFQSKTLNLMDAKIKFLIWDTAGQDRFRSLGAMYYRGSNVAILTYDITSMNTFEQVKGWYEELKSSCIQQDELIIVICGNKCDLTQSRVVKRDHAKQYADEIKAMYFETSAKDGTGIDEMFLEIAKKLISKNLQQQQQQTQQQQILKEKLNLRKSQPPLTNYSSFNSSFHNGINGNDDDDESVQKDTSSQCCS